MKGPYAVLLILAALLVVAPFFLLSNDARKQRSDGVVYRVAYSSAVKSIDPATAGDTTSASIQGNMYEGLYTYHFLKRPVEVVCQLAESMPAVSEDGLTYTIPLKPGVLFHRNPCFGPDSHGKGWATRKMTAHDFVFAFKRIADYHVNTGLGWAFLAGRIEGLDAFREKTKAYKIGDFSRYDLPVEGLQAVDDYTLRIRLTGPFPQFIYVLAMNTYAPIPHEAVSYWLGSRDNGTGERLTIPEHERSTEFSEPEHVVGTGPYVLAEWKRKWKFTFRRNPEYRYEEYPVAGEDAHGNYPGDKELGLLDDAGKRVPFIDEIHYRFIEEEYATWMMFLSRQTDVGAIPREAFNNVITPGKDLTDDWKNRGIYLEKSPYPAIYWFVFNMEDPLLGSCKALRQALCLAYDVESEIDVLLNGQAKRAVNIVPGSFKGHSEAGPGPYARFDVDGAKSKLAEATKELHRKGLLVDGKLPEIKLDLAAGPHATRVAEFAQQQFAVLGIKIKPVFNDWPTLQRKVHNKQAQMYTMGWHADYPDAENFLQLFYSGNIDKGTNNANYNNPEFDALYERVRLMLDSPERTVLYVQMIRMISEDCPILLLYEPESFTLFWEWVKNVKAHPIGYGYAKFRRIDQLLREQ